MVGLLIDFDYTSLMSYVSAYVDFIAQIASRDSLRKSSMIAGRHKQLAAYEIQDHELAGLQ